MSHCTRTLLLIGAIVAAPRITLAGDLSIEVTGLKGNSGRLMIALFDSAEQFLEDGQMAIGINLRLDSVERPHAKVVVTLASVAPGRFAISVFHDANGDGVMNRNLLQLPAEGRGFSNSASGRLGPPDFSAAAFDVGTEAISVPIHLRY